MHIDSQVYIIKTHISILKIINKRLNCDFNMVFIISETLTELNVKERMAKAGVKDIDAAYEKEQEEESDKEKEQSDKEQEDSDKENGPSKKKRKRTPKNFGTDFVTGQGLSSPAEDQVTDASTDEEMQETDKQSNTGLQTPETSPFQSKLLQE